MEKIMSFLKKNYLVILFWLIILLAFIVRFYDFNLRWGLGNDDARDIMIAKEAIARGELPLIGSFSSAGPFVFGPIFYWYLMLCYLILPSFLFAPWLITGILGVITVIIFMWCGKKIAGNHFALLVGLFAATSPQLVARSLALGQHTFVGFTTACMLLSFLFFFKKKKLFFAFLIGICIGAGINFHYQALNLLIFLALFLFIPQLSWKKKIGSFLLAGFGVLLAYSPLLIWDSQQQFANFRNILDYFLIGQHRLYVPNSWKLFLFSFLPSYWSFVIGHFSILAITIMFTVGITAVIALWKRKFAISVLLMSVPFTLLILLNRFYKGERSEGYLLYLLPFILLITCYGLYLLWQQGKFVVVRRIISVVLGLALLIGNCISIQSIIAYRSPIPTFEAAAAELQQSYPDKKFAVYDYKGSLSAWNQGLSAILFDRGLIAPNGIPIGVMCYHPDCPRFPKMIPENFLYIVDLRSVKNIDELNPLWVKVNPEDMYDDLIGWSKRHELKSNFYLDRYLKEKLHF
ncbi:MAG TPA: glycosyltransferase family 39 protein [Patescibacteria group bacterium]|nr:glycosyltransferase family 39 protein [Patescibacteria group bacterium]